MRRFSRYGLAVASIIVLVALVIPTMWIAIANGNGSGYLAKIPAVLLGVVIFVALINAVGYLMLDHRLRRLRTRHPSELFVGLIGRDETMLALAEGNTHAAAPSRPYVLEISSEGIRFWRRFNQPVVFAVIPREPIVRIASQPGRLGVRRATALVITVRTRTGERDIPLYLAGEGIGVLVNRGPEAVEQLKTDIVSRLRIDALPSPR